MYRQQSASLLSAIKRADKSMRGRLPMRPADLAGQMALVAPVVAPSPALSAVAAHNGTARLGRLTVLIATDLASLTLSGIAAWALWALPMKQQPLALYLELVPLLSLFVLGYAQAGLYPG